MIELYYSPKCAHCMEAKAYLENLDIELISHNLLEKSNSEIRKQYRDMGLKTLPIIKIIDIDGNETILSGFCENDIRRVLRL